MSPRPAHGEDEAQQAWIIFAGRADQPWLRLLRPGFRHCFAALRDSGGWTVLDPLSGRLLAARLAVPAAYDLPRFYRRAGLRPLGPFRPTPARSCTAWRLAPFNCVALCRAVLGPDAPWAVTPHGLYRRLTTLGKKA